MANIKTLSSTTILTATQAQEKPWLRINCPEVKVGLAKWCALSLTKQGRSLYQFNHEQLAEFLDHIPNLLIIQYSRKQEVQKGGTHEP